MPLSGRFSVRYSLSLQEQVNTSRVGSVSTFASNAKGDQSFALQTSAEKSTHHFQEVWANEHILCCAKNVAHWTLRLVFGSNFINQITRILNKHCNDAGNDEREHIRPVTFVKFMTAQIFPTTATQLEFLTSVSTASFLDMWIWPFLLDGALENLSNWHLPKQRYFI